MYIRACVKMCTCRMYEQWNPSILLAHGLLAWFARELHPACNEETAKSWRNKNVLEILCIFFGFCPELDRWCSAMPHCLPSHSPLVHALGIRFRVCLPCHGTRHHRMPQHAQHATTVQAIPHTHLASHPCWRRKFKQSRCKTSTEKLTKGTKGSLEEQLWK